MAASTHVLLKDPNGKVAAYDPDEHDVPFLIRNGFSRAPGVQVAAHMRVWPTGNPAPQDQIAPTQVATPAPAENTGVAPTPPPPSPPGVGEWDWNRFRGLNVPSDAAGSPQVTQPEPALLHSLPLITALTGLLAGPEGAVAGGIGGEALRQHLDRGLGYPVPNTPEAATQAMGLEGVKQAAYGLVGSGAAAGVKALANPVMQAAIRSGAPEAQALLDYGIRATKGGLQKLNGILGENGALGSLKASFLKRMSAMGVTHDPSIIARSAMSDIADRDPGVAKILSGGRLSPGAVITDVDRARAAKYNDLFQSWFRDNPSPIDPQDLEVARRRYDVAARAHYNTVAGNPSKAELDALDPKGIFNKAMADAMREQQDLGSKGLTAIHPKTGDPTTLAEVNGDMSRLARAQDFLAPLVGPSRPGALASLAERVVSRPTMIGAGIGGLLPGTPGQRGQHALEGALGGMAYQSPAFMSYLAHVLQNPAVAATLAQAPRVGVGGTLSALGH